jgi:hypothetical protein
MEPMVGKGLFQLHAEMEAIALIRWVLPMLQQIWFALIHVLLAHQPTMLLSE